MIAPHQFAIYLSKRFNLLPCFTIHKNAFLVYLFHTTLEVLIQLQGLESIQPHTKKPTENSLNYSLFCPRKFISTHQKKIFTIASTIFIINSKYKNWLPIGQVIGEVPYYVLTCYNLTKTLFPQALLKVLCKIGSLLQSAIASGCSSAYCIWQNVNQSFYFRSSTCSPPISIDLKV